ncbi:hypothetical protein HAX54_002008 [Datura stramonium]|uniref:BHLH domain-containing protein n=1 Tax=Datura stramonium TaxID=4076 RepID=A0ABS8T3W1_DATST|nr:hypothetical protein [Datura stramonium]
MNEGGDDNCLIWKNNEGWPFLNPNDVLVRSGEKFAGDKLSDLKSDTCHSPTSIKEMAEPSSVSKKRSLSDQNKDGKGSGKAKVGAGKGGEPDHEIHIQTERERRKKMRNMFSNLHALLPQLPPKTDKSTIVDEAVTYIKALQNTLQKLKKHKQERLQASMKLPSVGREQFLADHGSTINPTAIIPTNFNNNKSASTPLLMNNIPATDFQTWSSPNVVLNICGEEAHISVCCLKKPTLFSTICYILEKHNIEIVSAQLSSDHYKNMFMIQTHAKGEIKLDQFSEALPPEEIYKRAATEIMSFMGNP